MILWWVRFFNDLEVAGTSYVMLLYLYAVE